MVEDNPVDARMIRHTLKQDGFMLSWQCVQTEADYLQCLHTDIDIILADYTLPTFDALRALKLLHEQHANAQLFTAYDATIEGWVRALELRDIETEGHARRVSSMTLMLAQAMHVSPADLVHIRRGAFLHISAKWPSPITS